MYAHIYRFAIDGNGIAIFADYSLYDHNLIRFLIDDRVIAHSVLLPFYCCVNPKKTCALRLLTASGGRLGFEATISKSTKFAMNLFMAQPPTTLFDSVTVA